MPKLETLSKAWIWTDGTHFSKAWGINRPWSPACTTDIALDGGRVYGVWKSGQVNIDISGTMVPYKDPQNLFTFLEALDINTSILNANLADCAESVSPVVMAKLIDNPETVLVIYGEVELVSDALQTVLETAGIAENDYWYEKVQVCYWLPGARKTGKGRIQVKALDLPAGVRIKKKVCTALLDCEASQCLCHLATLHCRSRQTSARVAANVINHGSSPLFLIRGWQR